ncbi:hypothetical protein HDV05_001818 [Chytridiales sp. JEL 0842]|nr:hypothetical protein HDV05_001818 [Chytridiales sp. JEL 0842]
MMPETPPPPPPPPHDKPVGRPQLQHSSTVPTHLPSSTTNPNNMDNPDSPKYKYRYSGDLELRLPFETSPLAKPSQSFKNPDKWFEKVKTTAEERITVQQQQQQQHQQHLQVQTKRSFRESLSFLTSPVKKTQLATTSPTKRPLGPRSPNGGGSMYPPLSLSHSKMNSDLPLPPLFKQPRILFSLSTSLLSLLSFSIGIYIHSLFNRKPTDPAFNSTRSTLSFFNATQILTTLLTFLDLIAYTLLSKNLEDAFTAPFLIAFSTLPTFFSFNTKKREEEEGGGNVMPPQTPRKDVGAFPVLPLLDVGLHAFCTVLSFVGVCVLMSTTVVPCVPNGLNPCVGLWVVAVLGLGGLGGVGVLVVRKGWEGYQSGTWKLVLRRGMGRA